MQGQSDLLRIEREQIGLLVSALNSCRYCIAKQNEVLTSLGDEKLIIRTLSVGSLEGIDCKRRPLYEYVAKLTLSMERIRPSEIDAVYAVGWSDEAIEDAVCVASLFGQLNMLASGLGFGTSIPSAIRGEDVHGETASGEALLELADQAMPSR